MDGPVTLESLAAESARLRDVISNAQERLSEIETLLRLAEKYRLNTNTGPLEMTLAAQQRALANLASLAAHVPSGTSLKDRVTLGAESILSDGRRRTSRELIPELAKLGVLVETNDPPARVATYLSREKDRFESDVKAGGWTLKRLTKKARPGDVSPSAGLYVSPIEAPIRRVSAGKEDVEFG